jgi:demethylmenaquinone methyltransferase / 2-methoxy-6-polyprenyl-1,4-benzoquinol methylase
VDPATRDLFDANAASYDRVNTAISLGLDARWRDWAARRAVERPGARVLDAFAGTGLVGLRAAVLGAEVTLADGSSGMLEVARRRASAAGLDVRIVTADLSAERPEMAGAPFDAVTMVFGARYVDDPVRVVRGLASLLREGGTFVIVDFVEPDGSPLSRLAAFYFFRVLPLVAGLLAGRRELYDRLVVSTHEMGTAERLAAIATHAGLTVVETRTMGFGLVSGVVGRRSGAPLA